METMLRCHLSPIRLTTPNSPQISLISGLDKLLIDYSPGHLENPFNVSQFENQDEEMLSFLFICSTQVSIKSIYIGFKFFLISSEMIKVQACHYWD